MKKFVLTCTNSKGTCIYPAMSEADLTQHRVKINGVSINNMYYFYQLLDQLLERVYNELLLTNKHIYIIYMFSFFPTTVMLNFFLALCNLIF